MIKQLVTLFVLFLVFVVNTKTEVDNPIRLGFTLNEDYVEFFSRAVIPGDYLATGGSQIELLENFPKQNHVLIFSDITRLVSKPNIWAGKVDYIGYDLEGRELSVIDVALAADVARVYDCKLLLAPTAKLAEIYGTEIFPYADLIVVQFMRYQHDPALFREKLLQIKEMTGNTPLWVQVSTQKPLIDDPSLTPNEVAQEMYNAINPVRDLVDGVWVFWPYRGTPEEQAFGLEAIKLFVRMIR